MRQMLLIAAVAIPLAACNQGPSVSLTNASPEEVAKQTAAAGGPRTAFSPGLWETKVELLDMDMPGMEGMPKGFADKLKSEMKAHVTSRCMTPKEAQQPSSDVFTGNQKSNCTFSNYTMAGGKIDATMVCREKSGDMTMHMTGSFGADSFTIDQETTATGPKGKMHSKARVSARRVGDCAGGDAAK